MNTQYALENELELLLRHLLGEERNGFRDAPPHRAPVAEVTELGDLARRLRASFQWALPGGH